MQIIDGMDWWKDELENLRAQYALALKHDLLSEDELGALEEDLEITERRVRELEQLAK